MGLSLVYLCGVLALICGTQATYSSHSLRCDCRGHSQYCLRDALGLRCVNCQGNTEGRNCERCRAGFYLQENQRSCSPCFCHPAGSVSSQCDSRGHCSCKQGFTGDKCELCEDGQKIGADGCTRSRQQRQDSGSWSPSCFCFGHSSECSVQPGYHVYNISSTFSDGLDGWRAATLDGLTPRNVYFRWSPRHGDVEVISSNSQPVYLYAPARFLGDQLNSYGQNMSFSLRLDRGVRHPSLSDIILEGAGLSVSTSLGDMRHSVPCGQKIHYTFRLEESLWSPQLSSFSFQTLLQNLTAIKIRATFGHNGRGYLDNVTLVSARPGLGAVPAGWVRSCRCPPGMEGAQCERCAAGYRRSEPSRGAFSACEPCQCPKGSCDAQTGECLSSDDNNQGCSTGYSGPGCTECAEGFYRETVRGDGFPAPCQPCACDRQGAVSPQCDSSGTCVCRPGFEGPKCTNSECPSCFSPVTARLYQFALKVQELQSLFSGPNQGLAHAEAMEAALRSAQRQLEELQDDHQLAKDAERRLDKRLTSLGTEQQSLGQDLSRVSLSVQDVQDRQETYGDKVDTIEDMIVDMKRLLQQAQSKLTAVERPQADSPSDYSSDSPSDYPSDSPSETNPFSPLLQKALDLLQIHQSDASSIAEDSSGALKDSEQSAALLQTMLDREGNVQKITQNLQNSFDQISSEVKTLETQAPQISSNARDQSKKAATLLQDILKTEKQLPAPFKVDDMLSKLDVLKTDADGSLKDLDTLRATMDQEQARAKKLLDAGKIAQETFDGLVSRVDQAKLDTEDALRRINSNTDQLQDSLNTLKGFEQQMDQAKALSDAAIGRLPAIDATVQSAKRDNVATLALMDGVSDQLNLAGETRDQLKDAMDRVQNIWSSVPPTSGLLDKASLLRTQAEQLLAGSSSTAGEVKKELDEARTLNREAAQGAKDAQVALENTQKSGDAVRKTLRDVLNMINGLNVSEPVDLSRLESVEASLGAAQRNINLNLVPRLEQLQNKEQAHRRYLMSLDRDISTILKDIKNIEDILRSVPMGCYNNAPLEEA
ncbi:laminin subunit gamma-2 [Periophthalmus magnuspinnatus]|uniref:laminin subunit gamma-2 n=1 Tax=Periophthalmus magnuspinnatus TaxID=409849 RepID=UPI002436C496|nr:laminin subunit gamma-2 [Periophthalmus magnuspinnatus]